MKKLTNSEIVDLAKSLGYVIVITDDYYFCYWVSPTGKQVGRTLDINTTKYFMGEEIRSTILPTEFFDTLNYLGID